MRLLLVEDSERLGALLAERVHGAGWRLDIVETAEAAREAVRSIPYDLFLVDLGLPDGDGQQLIRHMRGSGLATPLMVITARGAIEERVMALDAGADDYLVKPFNHIELLARCRALLRRSGTLMAEIMEVGRLAFDPAAKTVRIGGELLAMPPRERSLLELLLRHANRVVPKERIEIALSEFGDEISTNAVEVAVSRLRRRLDPAESGIAIETVRGAGYLLREVARHG
jgi:two-component system response regulator TctD